MSARTKAVTGKLKVKNSLTNAVKSIFIILTCLDKDSRAVSGVQVQIPDKESDNIEFKLGLNNAVVVALAAFSNAKGGRVYVGITNNSKVSGIPLGQETLPQFLNEIKNKTSPSIIPDVETIDVDSGKKIVVLSVQEYPIKPGEC